MVDKANKKRESVKPQEGVGAPVRYIQVEVTAEVRLAVADVIREYAWQATADFVAGEVLDTLSDLSSAARTGGAKSFPS